MKNLFSLLCCLLVTVVLVQYRLSSPGLKSEQPLRITESDAFGYYAYLPAFFIYDDYKQLKWLSTAEQKYNLSGGYLYQANKTDNGNYVFKYLGGVAILQLPFFLAGHLIAKSSGYPADGFSAPYQYALSFGAILYSLLALLLLRHVLNRYFKDSTTALTILLLGLATNFLQYAAHDNGLSHVWIFPLYVLVLYLTIKWHEKPCWYRAAGIGYVTGLATISRPTEAVMLFIPLFWATQNKDAAAAKWALVKQHRSQVLAAIAFGLLGILPQLIYWKLASGSFIYDVGSKWAFLSPHFRVLFGWEKGWFIYTPVTLLFIAGMFFMRKYPFRKSVLWFCLLNIWIIIAWDDWRYGGSYSTRALMQSYPVFALPLAALIERVRAKGRKLLLWMLSGYLVFVNIFQTWQYSKTILHFYDMNRLYYGAIDRKSVV